MKFQALMEQYCMLKQTKRLFYPRNLSLSDKFTKALREELLLQEKAGIPPEKFAHKLNRALQFHINEHKKTPAPK